MRHRRHEFGADYLLDCVVRLKEIIERYQFLVDELLAKRPSYPFGGGLTLAAWLEQVESGVVADALQLCGGEHYQAMRLVGDSTRRHFGKDADKRRRWAQRSFAEVEASRAGTERNWNQPRHVRRA